MSANSKIEWTDATWNPVRGCTKVSPGCKHCYAETFAERWRGVPGHPYEQGFDLRLVPEKLTEPLHWRKPSRVFVNSMSDLLHKDVPEEFIWQVFAVMANTPQHSFQVLTKRADRLAELLATGRNAPYFYGNVRGSAFRMKLSDSFAWPLPNVWIGVSVESQEYAEKRIPHLLRTPAAVRFLSCEPLLGPVNLTHLDADGAGDKDFCQVNALTGRHTDMARPCPDVAHVDWVIVGGESGRGARPMDLAWARSLVEQCKAAGVATFVKQLGARAEEEAEGLHGSGLFTLKLRHKKGGEPAEWPADLRIRQFPEVRR